eukprot:scaffold4877_cov171-Ochromonas_danica.AAC.20
MQSSLSVSLSVSQQCRVRERQQRQYSDRARERAKRICGRQTGRGEREKRTVGTRFRDTTLKKLIPRPPHDFHPSLPKQCVVSYAHNIQ